VSGLLPYLIIGIAAVIVVLIVCASLVMRCDAAVQFHSSTQIHTCKLGQWHRGDHMCVCDVSWKNTVLHEEPPAPPATAGGAAIAVLTFRDGTRTTFDLTDAPQPIAYGDYMVGIDTPNGHRLFMQRDVKHFAAELA
jgi:hypothetical protein